SRIPGALPQLKERRYRRRRLTSARDRLLHALRSRRGSRAHSRAPVGDQHSSTRVLRASRWYEGFAPATSRNEQTGRVTAQKQPPRSVELPTLERESAIRSESKCPVARQSCSRVGACRLLPWSSC